jgi:hypothetical protein
VLSCRKNSFGWPWDIICSDWSYDASHVFGKTLRTKLMVDVFMGILNACVY